MPSAPHRPGPRCAGDISNGTADFGRIFFRCTFIADAGFVAVRGLAGLKMVLETC